jgi:hypothetical protein
MKLVGFKIDKETQNETFVYQRESFDEKTKMNLRYALWTRGNKWYFGIADSSKKPLLGIELFSNKKMLLEHLDYIIQKGIINVHYFYLPPPPERTRNGYYMEIINNPIKTTLELPKLVIENLEKIRKIIKTL